MNHMKCVDCNAISFSIKFSRISYLKNRVPSLQHFLLLFYHSLSVCVWYIMCMYIYFIVCLYIYDSFSVFFFDRRPSYVRNSNRSHTKHVDLTRWSQKKESKWCIVCNRHMVADCLFTSQSVEKRSIHTSYSMCCRCSALSLVFVLLLFLHHPL